MPYVQPLDIDDAPKKSQPILTAIQEKFGRSMNIFSTAAHQPDLLGGMTQINDGIRNDLPDKFRELAYMKASHINACEYCSHYHEQAAKQAGISDQQIAQIGTFESSDAFDDEEKAVLSYAEQLTKTANIDAATVHQLKEFLDDKQLVSLAGAVALANFTNRFNHGLDIQLP
ncbi:Carboxymuconolactone decarboxylase family protein [Rubripirellula lacrimiformis]|uniref:Carboxymuconolactone decarboxylase family protein n=1 Tax=Rubripirellula lacrimiformis TaxID=1930273 RepID=A0A517NCI7_9BACT|nr:carboxymuconolactone decarboxylase family protein [Rubripirellula lacrimiformis]QDT04768.1 Carboxymuconolactone decarboxylase family protein [Rubripirellula lacrimiformis]